MTLSSSHSHAALFQPIDFGALALPNRIVMAPLTRGRAGRDATPTAIMAEYYAQRATAGLIISEATGISREGLGWPHAPGLWTEAHVEGWKAVTEAVHQAGGRIVAQLWHMGRISHPDLNDGNPPVSASATRAPGQVHTYEGKKDAVDARPLRLDEMPRVLDDYTRAAENARKAGFDGVQLHAANGYLIDQFLRDNSNFRTDEYGGSPQNRVRLLREAMERLIAVWGAERVGVRLSPNGNSQGVEDSNPADVFGLAARELEKLKPAFIELRQPGPNGTFGSTDVPQLDGLFRQHFTGPLVLNSDYTPEHAAADIASGRADAISFGRPFISNPDLVDRIAKDAPLAPNKNVPESWYANGPEGYIDYPALAEATA